MRIKAFKAVELLRIDAFLQPPGGTGPVADLPWSLRQRDGLSTHLAMLRRAWKIEQLSAWLPEDSAARSETERDAHGPPNSIPSELWLLR